MNVNNINMTQDYFDFILECNRVQSQLDMLEEIVSLIKNGMNIYNAIEYQIQKTNKKSRRLKGIKQYYKGKEMNQW